MYKISRCGSRSPDSAESHVVVLQRTAKNHNAHAILLFIESLVKRRSRCRCRRGFLKLPVLRGRTPFSSPEPPGLWSRGRRNGGLWSQPIPDIRKSRTTDGACIILANTSAHTQKLILREGREVAREGQKGCTCVVSQCRQMGIRRSLDRGFRFAEVQ